MMIPSQETATGDGDLIGAEKGVPVEAEDTLKETEGSGSARKRRLLWISMFLIALVVAVVIPTSIVKSRDDTDKNSAVVPPKEGSYVDNSNVVPPVDDPAIDDPDVVDDNGNQSTATSTTKTSPFNGPYYHWNGLIYDMKIPVFSPDIVQGYNSEEELREDLTELAKFLVNKAAEQALNPYFPPPLFFDSADDTPVDAMPGAPVPIAGSAPASPSAEGATDYETNNQVQGVDEGDMAKSDGTYVYVAYGDAVIVWEANTGKLVTNVTLPPVTAYNVMDDESSQEDLVKPSGVEGGRKADVMMDPRPRIQSLLLGSNRLVVVANGYGYKLRQKLPYKPAFYNLLETNVRVYEISASGELTFLKETFVDGSFSEARLINNNAHLVSYASLDHWSYFNAPLDRYQPQFQGLSDDEYLAAAATFADDELIHIFVDDVVRDLTIDGTLPNMPRISLWQFNVSHDGSFDSHVLGDSFVEAFAHVSSFDITDPSLELSVSPGGAFMPVGWGTTYANNDMMALVGTGWDFDGSAGASVETTYLLCLKFDEATATPAAVGSVPGSILNQFSVDIMGNHMRIATTISSIMPFVVLGGPSVDFFVPPPPPATQNQVLILEIPEMDGVEPAILNETGRISGLGRPLERFTAVRYFGNIAYAVTFERKDPFYALDLSDVENPVVLGELNVTGFSSYLHSMNAENTLIIALGEEADELGMILGIQLSLFDARDPANLVLLHREVVENDRDTWSSSSVSWNHKAFRYLPLDGYDSDTNSVISRGIVIIPMRVSPPWGETNGFFDGFLAYDVSEDGIFERFSISHVDPAMNIYGCFGSRLAERSMVFDGNVTTMKSHSIVHTDLDTGVPRWRIDLQSADVDGCYPY